jgi:hypothetical protein
MAALKYPPVAGAVGHAHEALFSMDVDLLATSIGMSWRGREKVLREGGSSQRWNTHHWRLGRPGKCCVPRSSDW